MEQRNATALPSELWSVVFAHLEELPGSFRPWWNAFDNPDQKQNQMGVHQLKLVCKQFADIYSKHSGLVQRLHLDAQFSVSSLPSLLAWLQQGKSALQTFHSACERPLMDVVLAGLVSSKPSLRMVDIRDTSECSVAMVGMFTNLEKCALWRTEAELDLASLAALPRLHHLMLQNGMFKQLHQLKHLTRLDCIDVIIRHTQEFTPTLQHLVVQDSYLHDSHARGLSVCTALTQLVWCSAALMMNNEEEVYLDEELSVIPSNMRLLTQLHTLHLDTSSPTENRANLQWVSELTSLQDLSIIFSSSDANVVQHASMLTRLTRLQITGLRANPDELSAVDVDIEWHGLQALQDLSIRTVRLKLGNNAAGLLQLHHLQLISFIGVTFDGQHDRDCFAAVIRNLAAHPHLQLEWY